MKKGILRIILGTVLIIFQALSLLGNAKAGVYPSISFSSPSLFLYDLIVLISYFFVGILGSISLVSGIIASHRGEKKVTSTAASTPVSSDSVCSAPDDPSSQKRHRYCRFCGGEIDHETRKCSKCGKQYFRLRITKAMVSVFIAIILVATTVFLSIYCIDQYKEQISQLSAKILELESAVELRNETIKQYEQQIADKNQRNKELVQEKSELERKTDFYDKHIVFVPDDNTKQYHKYDCIVFRYSNESFWAYNIEAAKSRGYTACFVCD